MKFRDPKTGEVFESIEAARVHYCIGKDCELECEIASKGNTCSKWARVHPIEAARLMGYEVIDEEGQVEKMDKPRICQVLGVEVGELFRFDYPFRIYSWLTVKPDRRIWEVPESGNPHKIGTNALYYILEHLDRIIRKPRFTQEEVAVLRTLYAAGARYLARGDKHLRWYAHKPYQRAEDDKWDMRGDWGTMSGRLPVKLFPSLRPGMSVRLEEVCGHEAP